MQGSVTGAGGERRGWRAPEGRDRARSPTGALAAESGSCQWRRGWAGRAGEGLGGAWGRGLWRGVQQGLCNVISTHHPCHSHHSTRVVQHRVGPREDITSASHPRVQSCTISGHESGAVLGSRAGTQRVPFLRTKGSSSCQTSFRLQSGTGMRLRRHTAKTAPGVAAPEAHRCGPSAAAAARHWAPRRSVPASCAPRRRGACVIQRTPPAGHRPSD